MKPWTITNENMPGILPYIKTQIVKFLEGGPVALQLSRPSKSREQEQKYHAMIGDIARQVILDGRKYAPEVWKALLVDEFEQELKANGEGLHKPSQIVISLDKQRAVTIRPSTAEFRRSEGAQFIEFLAKYGAEFNVVWSEK